MFSCGIAELLYIAILLMLKIQVSDLKLRPCLVEEVKRFWVL